MAGTMPETGVFAKKEEHEVEYGADVEWLDLMAEDFREELTESFQTGDPDEVERAIYEITNGNHEGGNEVQRGWAEGFYSEGEVS